MHCAAVNNIMKKKGLYLSLASFVRLLSCCYHQRRGGSKKKKIKNEKTNVVFNQNFKSCREKSGSSLERAGRQSGNAEQDPPPLLIPVPVTISCSSSSSSSSSYGGAPLLNLEKRVFNLRA